MVDLKSVNILYILKIKGNNPFYATVAIRVFVQFLVQPSPRSWNTYQKQCYESGESVLYGKNYVGSTKQDENYWTPMFRTHRYIKNGKYCILNNFFGLQFELSGYWCSTSISTCTDRSQMPDKRCIEYTSQ